MNVGVEARSSPRYLRQLEVNIDGLEIVTTNVSLGGAQLSCPEMRFKGLQCAVQGTVLRLKIRLPRTRKWLAVVGDIRYADLCEDEYLIGFQFSEFADNAREEWEAFISTLAETKPAP